MKISYNWLKELTDLDLSPRDLSFVTADGVRQIVPGQYLISVGSGQPDTATAHQSASFAMTRVVKLPE